MNLKGKFEQSSAIVQILILFFVIMVGLVFVTMIINTIVMVKFEIESTAVTKEVINYMIDSSEWTKNVQFFQIVGVFILPAIICAWLFSDNYKNYLRIDTFFQFHTICLVMLSMLIIIPILNSIYEFNQHIVFSQYFKNLEKLIKNQENFTKNIIDKMLCIHSWQDLIYTILIVCVFTSIGEEFIFRGILQNILHKFIKNSHIVIWITAVFFSVVHLQFSGFLPRVLLGAYLGYLLYYTGNIWVPISAHFTNNFLGVINFYLFQKEIRLAKKIDSIGGGSTWWLSIVSLVIFFIIFYHIKNNKSNTSNLSKEF
ncbi:MAG: CPBP family intramembrane metalloprotease [Bacteroidales bacterium OttesenSCG-928-I14]|jgi:membrane protease YdiL (CAAX protease family)|nr:CPBP family intramembrane metalloprotease [Bacteroidales bacterium OttesenSCG-928-I14]